MDTPSRDAGSPPAFRQRAPGEPGRPGQIYESPTLPLPPPKARAELDDLLHAVASTPSSQRQLVIDTIDGFTDRERVAGLLHDDLMDLPSGDTGRHLMLLSITGQLAHPSSIEVLERFVWLGDADIYGDILPDIADGQSGDACHFRPDSALQARAAEMLVWVSRDQAVARVARILESHPASSVRRATIDALAYAAGDAPDELGRFADLVREEDRWAIGVPRRTAGGDPEDFDARVQARHEAMGSLAEPGRPEADDRGGRDVH